MLGLDKVFRKKAPPEKSKQKKKPDWRVIETFRTLGAREFVAERRKQLLPGAPRVLMATSALGYNHGTVMDTTVGLSLLQRGADVHFLACDKFLPACQLMKFKPAPEDGYPSPIHPKKCEACYRLGSATHGNLGFPVHAFGEILSENERTQIATEALEFSLEEIPRYEEEEIAVGEHAYAGALRFFARGDLSGEPEGEAILRKYFQAALSVKRGMEKLCERKAFDVAVIHHGIYAPQGVVAEACRRYGVRVVTWNPAYRKQTFIFSHEKTYHHTMVSEPTDHWDAFPLTANEETELEDYLQSRRYGTQDWIWFHREPEHDQEKIRKQLNLDPNKPLVTLLSNVVWDARLHYATNAFPGMLEWVLETIEYFRHRPDLQLVIRVHPAELTGFVVSRQLLVEEIQKQIPKLPRNVVVVGPENQTSTYTLCDMSNSVLIYNTKTGMEVTAQGIPTVVAGEAWIRGKGFAACPTSREIYFAELDKLPARPMSAEAKARARRYAYHVFFRRMIPLSFMESVSRPELHPKIEKLTDLAPGKNRGLDTICQGILEGTPFVYEAVTS